MSFVHGFTQTSRSWNAVINELPEFSCISIDAPGHGDSADAQRSLHQCGMDIAETMIAGTLVGYSMGARMALHTALLPDTPVQRLVLVSGTAGIEDRNEREQRVNSDEALADHIEEVGVPAFISEWLSNPMFAGLTQATAHISERERNTAKNLADSLRFAGTGTQEPLWNKLCELSMPVLIIAGEHDAKFCSLAQKLHHEIKDSQLEVISGAGHTVHLENHSAFMKTLRAFLL